MSKVEEQEYAAKIYRYWLGRGYNVDVQIGVAVSNGHIAQVVRSALVNGLPPNIHPSAQLDVAIKVRREPKT